MFTFHFGPKNWWQNEKTLFFQEFSLTLKYGVYASVSSYTLFQFSEKHKIRKNIFFLKAVHMSQKVGIFMFFSSKKLNLKKDTHSQQTFIFRIEKRNFA